MHILISLEKVSGRLFNHVASQAVLVIKNPHANAGDIRDKGLIPELGRFPWRRAWQPTPVFLPGEEPGRLQSMGLQRVGHD